MTTPSLSCASIAAARPIELRPHGDFIEWLAATGGTLAATTYNSGKLAFFSAPAGKLVASCWAFPRPMGLAVNGSRMALAVRDRFWTFAWRPRSEEHDSPTPDRLTPESQFATGRLDAHDVAFDRRGPIFANTRFNCIARPSEQVNFIRSWQPAFMSAAKMRTDCCHLNGVGVRNGRLAVATAFCERAEPAAWREGDRFQSGVLIDAVSNEIVAQGLCMPHSPRRHAGRWWLCDSGRGGLVLLDPQRGRCEPIAALPGFTRGLAFVAGRAAVGLSRIRKRHILDAPPVRQRWRRLRSGIALVDPSTGAETGSLEFVHGGREVYDVAFLPGVLAPAISPP